MASHFTAHIKSGDTYKPTTNVSVVTKLDKGLYNVTQDMYGNFTAIKKNVNITEILPLPEPESIEVLNQIKKFYQSRELFKKWNFNHKRGILLHGVAGGGKTSLISSIINFACNEIEGVAFYVPSVETFNVYKNYISTVFREMEPETPIIMIIEDIDSYFSGAGTTSYESNLLNTIDGVENKDNILYLATTNYPEKLPDRIYNRPGRFDLKIEIKTPCDESREFYLTNKILAEHLSKIDLKKWVRDTDGMTIVQLSELVKAVFLLELDYKDVLKSLKDKKIPSSLKYVKSDPVGFKFLSGIEETKEAKPTREAVSVK